MNRETIERSLVEQYREYRAAIERKDGFEVCKHYGSMNNMKRVLSRDYGLTDDEVQALISDEGTRKAD